MGDNGMGAFGIMLGDGVDEVKMLPHMDGAVNDHIALGQQDKIDTFVHFGLKLQQQRVAADLGQQQVKIAVGGTAQMIVAGQHAAFAVGREFFQCQEDRKSVV